MTDSPFVQGFEAKLDGLALLSCQFTDPEERAQFVAGYLEACRQSIESKPTKAGG